MSNTVTKNEFLKELREDVDEWSRQWSEGKANDPGSETWPDKMLRSDWFEQFLLFVESR
jgi:hypothetical protein